MRNNRLTPFAAIFQNELLFNLKRVAPYALMFIFSANAWLWIAKGAAVSRGWAVNSDFYIARLFLGFSFITGLPLFIALMMGDPVIRDFRIGVDPLIFSKPVGRVQYLLGKFFGNFFVLVCCQACFALTALLLQAFSIRGVIVLQPRLFPYFQHFFFFVVVSSLALGAVCFTVGTLTRNVKIVYGLAISFYPLYIAWQVSMKGLPMRWRIALDPLLFNASDGIFNGRSADWLNQAVVGYDAYMIGNRVAMIAVSLVCLAILYLRFSTTERADKHASQHHTLTLDLAPKAWSAERLNNETARHGAAQSLPQSIRAVEAVRLKQPAMPRVNLVTSGLRAGFEQFKAALGVEFRLLRAERSLIVVAPLIMFLCSLEVAVYQIVPEVSYAATYSSRMANALLLFLSGIAVFYVGETMHRDREAGIEPVLWSAPVSNPVLLLSKFSAALLLSLTLMLLVALTAVSVQVYRGHAPLELQIHFVTYAVILVPGIFFLIAASVALNILLRDKYLAYAVSLALGATLYYLTGQGYHNWLYNPVMYRLWTPSELFIGGSHLTRILHHRLYCLALSAFLLALSLLFFQRKSSEGLRAEGRLSDRGWAMLAAVISAAAAIITGLIISHE